MKFFLEEDINCIFDSLKNKSNKLSGKNILISGGAGFLGTYFVQVINKLNERKFKKPCKVHIIDRFIDKEKKKFLNKNKNFSFLEKDVSKHLSIKNQFIHNNKDDYEKENIAYSVYIFNSICTGRASNRIKKG